MSDIEFNKIERFTCDCGYWKDYIAVEYDRSDWNNDGSVVHDSLTLHVQMNHFLPWYKRLARAFLYVVAKDAKWYHWSETILSKEDAGRLRDLLDEYTKSPH